MPVWRRYIVREASGHLTELSSRLFDRAEDRVAPLPGFAGQCVDVVSAVLVGEQGQNPTLAEMSFTKLYFDAVGFVDRGKRDRMIRLMLESCEDRRCRSGSVAGRSGCDEAMRRAGRARARLASEFGWQPKPAEVTEVLHRLDLPVSSSTFAVPPVLVAGAPPPAGGGRSRLH